jgi:exonuclease VII small subunit
MSQPRQQFSEYDESTQQHIIRLGCFIYDKSLEHIRETLPSTSTVSGSSPVIVPLHWDKEYEYNQLKQQAQHLSTRVFEVREEEYKKGEAKAAEYKQQLAAERQRLDKILANIHSDTERQITAKTDHLNP